jgi:predicted phage tail component-like protein
MELKESGLSFNGQHSMNDFNCFWIEDGGHPVAPACARPRYAIAGAGGRTVPVGPSVAEAMEVSGTLVLQTEPPNQIQAQMQLREIQKWLAGSGKLIFDYEPDKYYMATVEELVDWSLKNWFGGEIGVTFRLEPYAYSLQRVTASGSLAAASSGYECTFTIDIPGIRDVPAAIELSGVAYHSCSVAVNGETQCEWANSTSLGSGVRLYSEWPGLTGDESNYPVTGSGAWTQAPGMILLKPGTNTVTVTADATGSVTVYARPRW